ncbi:hypothetical protein ON010_g14798 [Phytophthora cinnamomi]|nr:hypothetical protein ON010_g14798 [Phytophthora cinnamomi]
MERFSVPSELDPEFEGRLIVDILSQRQYILTTKTKTALEFKTESVSASIPAVEESVKYALHIQTVMAHVQNQLAQEKVSGMRQRIQNILEGHAEVPFYQQELRGQERKVKALAAEVSTTNDRLQQALLALSEQENKIKVLKAEVSKANQVQQIFKAQLKGNVSEIAHLKQVVSDQARKLTAVEVGATVSNTRARFAQVLDEITRKNFGAVLVQIALTRQEGKAATLNFGAVFVENEKAPTWHVELIITSIMDNNYSNELTLPRLMCLFLMSCAGAFSLEPTTGMGDLDRVQRYRGCLALRFGANSTVKREIRRILGLPNNQQCRFAMLPEDEWHMTLVTKEELRGLSADAVQEAVNVLSTRCFAIGLGGGGGATANLDPSGVYFIVCVWPKAQAFRAKYGLPPKDFHVSVSTTNRHDIDKTSDALLDEACVKLLDKYYLEALSRQVMLEQKLERAVEIGTLLCTRFGDGTTLGWVRLADAALLAGRPKLAMLGYGHLIKRMISGLLEGEGIGRGSPLWKHCCKQISKCADTTEWGPVFVDGEIDQVPPGLRRVLCAPWGIATWMVIRDSARSTSSLSYPSRERFTTPYAAVGDCLAGSPTQYTLPRFFRWIVPFQLAAMSTPRNRDDIRCLCGSLHVRHIVTLTEEEPLPAAWFEGLPNIKNTFLPVANYHAPSTPQIDMFMRLCCTSSPAETPVLVHCGGGKGRAGTIIACYLVAFGFAPPPPELVHSKTGSNDGWFQPAMTATEAIQALRAMRPGSVETKEQEEAVSTYCSLLWKRRGVFPPETAQPLPSRPEITGKPVETTDLLVLCGIPGSGKSSFRRALAKRNIASRVAPSTVRANNALYQPWTEIHSDEVGRKGCERSIGQGSLRRAILDRCNGIAADRKTFLSLATTWSHHATAVVFDIPTKLCEARAMQRADHPTLPPGRRVEFAVRQHSSTFEYPNLAEGFQTIVRITSVEAALELADLLSPPLPLLKFPRTAHLLDLGAATSDDLVTDINCISLPADEETTIAITEKVDGANMGISLSADGALVVQNRSHVVNSETHRQFRALDEFLSAHRAVLYDILHRDPLFPGRFILPARSGTGRLSPSCWQ